jgi:D-arabinose 1-dehydrogenase-like Zn-dependent alcohol dehydrogenase
MAEIKAYAAQNAKSGLGPVSIQRRSPRAQDVQIAILYCGVCHSDLASFSLIFKRSQLAGSAIGGIRETQEMLDFCGENGITADIELIRI